MDVKMTIRKGIFRYFDLLGEIRNNIMRDVHPWMRARPVLQRQSRPSTIWKALSTFLCWLVMSLATYLMIVRREPKPRPILRAKWPGFQSLATCRQAYLEGHIIFYSDNAFHITPGPVNTLLAWRKGLQPQHRATIKSVCLNLTIADLTPLALREVDRMRQVWGEERNFEEEDRSEYEHMAVVIGYYLRNQVWLPKLQLLRQWQMLDLVLLKSTKITIPSDGADFRQLNERHFANFCTNAAIELGDKLVVMVREVGWERTRKWLVERA